MFSKLKPLLVTAGVVVGVLVVLKYAVPANIKAKIL